jgi:hypothetical protein
VAPEWLEVDLLKGDLHVCAFALARRNGRVTRPRDTKPGLPRATSNGLDPGNAKSHLSSVSCNSTLCIHDIDN